MAAVPGPRLLVTTPLQLRAFLQAALDLRPLTRVVSATAAIDPAMAAAAERAWDTILVEIFGATELGSVATRRTVTGELWHTYPGLELIAAGAAVQVSAPHAAPAPLDDAIGWQGGPHFALLGRHSDVVKLGGRRASLSG